MTDGAPELPQSNKAALLGSHAHTCSICRLRPALPCRVHGDLLLLFLLVASLDFATCMRPDGIKINFTYKENFFYSISYSLLHRPLITYCSIITRSVVSYPLSRLFMSHSIDLVFHSQPFHFESGVTKHLLAPHHSYISWMAWSPSTFTSGKTPFSYKHRATNYVPLLRMTMFFGRSNNLI